MKKLLLAGAMLFTEGCGSLAEEASRSAVQQDPVQLAVWECTVNAECSFGFVCRPPSLCSNERVCTGRGGEFASCDSAWAADDC